MWKLFKVKVSCHELPFGELLLGNYYHQNVKNSSTVWCCTFDWHLYIFKQFHGDNPAAENSLYGSMIGNHLFLTNRVRPIISPTCATPSHFVAVRNQVLLKCHLLLLLSLDILMRLKISVQYKVQSSQTLWMFFLITVIPVVRRHGSPGLAGLHFVSPRQFHGVIVDKSISRSLRGHVCCSQWML